MGEVGYTANRAAGGRGKRSLGFLARLDRVHVDPAAGPIEADAAVRQGKDGVIAAQADVFTGDEFRPALPHDDVAGYDHFAAKFFHAETFADAIAAVLNA